MSERQRGERSEVDRGLALPRDVPVSTKQPETPICAVCGEKWGQFLHDPLTGKDIHTPRCPKSEGEVNVRRFVPFGVQTTRQEEG